MTRVCMLPLKIKLGAYVPSHRIINKTTEERPLLLLLALAHGWMKTLTQSFSSSDMSMKTKRNKQGVSLSPLILLSY